MLTNVDDNKTQFHFFILYTQILIISLIRSHTGRKGFNKNQIFQKLEEDELVLIENDESDDN